MKKLLTILLIFIGINIFAESKIPDYLHLKTDIALNMGNTYWPGLGFGISNHTKLSFDVWDNGKAGGSIDTGIAFYFQSAPVSSEKTYGPGPGAEARGEIEYAYGNYTPTIQWSLGHTFYFLENRDLFLSIYSMLGYSWRITKISDIYNETSLELTTDELAKTVGAFTASLSVQLGYNFHENVGIFGYGNYIIPVEPGVHGNYNLGFGLNFNIF